MSSSSFLLTLITFSLMLCVPTHSLTCSSQKFTNSNLYTNCTDLPTLNSYLHYTYNPSNSTLSIAFIATPPKADGWVAWAINPTSVGMIGAQSLIAFKTNGSLSVNTYNLTSYTTITQSKLSFDVWDLKAEENKADGSVVIYGSMKVPGNPEKLNHLWQVGSNVDNGVPVKHDLAPANANAKAVLNLVSNSSSSSWMSPAWSPSAAAPAPAKANSGFLMKTHVGFVFGLVLLVSFVMSF